ncbi:MAG: spermine/spermidine synthase domain-containing protein [Planctomycetota bacterium]|jgi:hypothetical protein
MRDVKAKLTSLFVLAMAVLMIEICLTRIFSVLSWHHFAYLIISLALLGFGAAGSYLTVAKRFNDEQIKPERLAWFAWMFAVSLICATVVASKIRFFPADIVLYRDYSNILSLLLLYLITGIPFFFAGVCIGRLVAFSGEKVNLFYFADLAGAGTGALIALAVITYLGAVAGVFLGAGFACFAACLLSAGCVRWQQRMYRITFVICVGLVVLASTTNIVPLYYPPSKTLFRGEHKVEHSRWHIVGKIDITRPEPSYFSFGGALSRQYKDPPPMVRNIYQDGAAPTGIVVLDESVEEVPILREYLQGVPYVIQDANKTLIIGVGGGIDALIALDYGTAEVVGVDLNPIIVDAVEKRFRSECPLLWKDGRFRIQVDEGRHYLSENSETFDVIQLSGVDTYTALSTGAYALAENFLYTREAMKAYWQHLTDDGIISFSRWLFDPPRETLRLVTTQLDILDEIGVVKAQNRFVVVSGPAYYNRPPWAEVLLK